MTTPNQPGWYDDSDDPNALRYWDGKDWTPLRQPKPALPSARVSTPLRQPLAPDLPPPPVAAPSQAAPPLPPPPDHSAPPAGWYPDPTGKSGEMYWDGREWDQSPTPAAGAQLAPRPETQPAVGHAQQLPGNYPYKNPILYALGGFVLPPLVLFLMGGSRTTCAWMIGLWVLFWITVWFMGLGAIFAISVYIWSVVACYKEATKQNQAHGFAS